MLSWRDRIDLLKERLAIENDHQLERMLGLGNAYINNLIVGKNKNPLKIVVALVSKYHLDVNWLFDETLTLEEARKSLLQSHSTEDGDFLTTLNRHILDVSESRFIAIELRLSALETVITKPPVIFMSEPEPEYGEVEDDVTFVEGIAAGKPISQSEIRSTIPVPRRFIKTKPEDYYVGRIRGTSMISAGIPDGGLVLIRYSDTPRDGAIQVVEHQGEATLKRMREVPGQGWKICFEDGSEEVIEVGPGDEFHIQGDFVVVLPEKD
jgi:SOS-response transcriptional repressor LexA